MFRTPVASSFASFLEEGSSFQCKFVETLVDALCHLGKDDE